MTRETKLKKIEIIFFFPLSPPPLPFSSDTVKLQLI